MVSSSNIILVGLALLAGVFLLRGSSQTSVPAVSVADKQDPEIPLLENLLGQAQSLFKQTFPPPFKQVIRQPSQLRGPNVLGSFQAKGTRTTIDPFSGRRIAIGQTFRGTSRGAAVFGGVGQLESNRQRVIQGNILKSSLSDFIADITNQLNIKQTNSV